jgi:5-methylcytosine-specific restriction endonuclease McrA
MADEILKKVEPKPRKPTGSAPAPDVTLRKRVAIPAAIKRKVMKSGKCSYIDPKTGKSCDSTYFLETDHIIPVALGGTNDQTNLRLYCRGHNQRASVKIFGPRDL